MDRKLIGNVNIALTESSYSGWYSDFAAGDIKSLELLLKEVENEEIKKLLEFHLHNLEVQDSITDQILKINQVVPHVPFLMIREYLEFCDGSTENALNMILNNIPIQTGNVIIGRENLKILHDQEELYLKRKLELEDFRKQSYGIGLDRKLEEEEEEEEDGGEGEVATDESKKDEWVTNEKNLIEMKLIEDEKRRNTRFYCLGERKMMKGSKPQIFTIERSSEFYATGEEFHYRFAESQFHRWLGHYGGNTNWEIERIEYVVNPEIINQFEKCKEDLAEKHKFLKSSMKPTMLFHGTSKEAQSSILKTNFIRSKIGSNTGNKGYYGCGFYFSECPQYSIPYNRGCSQLLVCLGLTGRAFTAVYKVGREREAGYDSHVSDNGYEVVIYEPGWF